MKYSLCCDCCYSSLAAEETQEYKGGGGGGGEEACWWLQTHLSVHFPVSNVLPKPGIHSLTDISHLLVPVPLCTIIPHQLPKISIFPCTPVPLHSSQTNSPSMISSEDA